MKWRELNRPIRHAIVPFALVVAAATGAVATGTVTATPAEASAPLRQHASARGVQIGSAVAAGPLGSDASYRTTLGREFNSVTPENELKWDATEPNPGQYNFGGADAIVNSASANRQRVRGHTFVWHSQAPGWLQSLPAADLRAAMRRHITTLAGRYRGRIYAWDVVNEAFNEDGTLRDSFWLQRLGPGYIAEAFRLARQADPSAKLYLNDFNVEGVNAKSTAMFNLVRDLRRQGVPIDGVGVQGHLATQFGFPGDIQQNLRRFVDLGVEVAITELDVRMPLPPDATKLATQASAYANVVRACLSVGRRCAGVTVWGFTDRYSWVPGTFPGQGAACLYDENSTAKPAYTAVHDVLASGARSAARAAWRPDRR